ncbi:MAG: HAD family hydrolase, partial [Gemmiger sp.]
IHTEEDTPLIWQKLALFYGYQGAFYAPEELHAAFESALASQNAAAGQSYECYPELPIESVFKALFQQKGVRDDLDRKADEAAQFYRALCTEYIRLYPGVQDAFAQLRKDGHRLWLLSNAQHAFTARELWLLELFDKFDKVYLSSDYQCRKPDVRFFTILLEEQQLDKTDSLMIGNDATTDIAGARAAGLDTLYLHTNLSPEITEEIPATYQLQEQDWNRILPFLRSICE